MRTHGPGLFQQPKVSLNQYQQNTLDEFSGKGLRDAFFSGCGWFNDYYHQRAFSFLVNKKGCSLVKAFWILKGFDKDQAYGILQGLSQDETSGLTRDQIDVFLKYGGLSMRLSRDEMSGLNEFQMEALETCRTIKNGLSVQHLHDKDWFDSKKHIEALKYMLSWGEFTVEEALAELDGLRGDQARLISEGKKRSDVVGFSEFQLEALNYQLKWIGVTASHLRGRDWFNSDNHIHALERLLEKDCVITIENALDQLKDLNADQLEFLIEDSAARIITPIQVIIWNNREEYGFYGSTDELLKATWLNTNEQAELLKKLFYVVFDNSIALAMVKYKSDKCKVKETLKKIQNGEIGCEKIWKLFDYCTNEQSVYAGGNSLFGTSSDISDQAAAIAAPPPSPSPSFRCNII